MQTVKKIAGILNIHVDSRIPTTQVQHGTGSGSRLMFSPVAVSPERQRHRQRQTVTEKKLREERQRESQAAGTGGLLGIDQSSSTVSIIHTVEP